MRPRWKEVYHSVACDCRMEDLHNCDKCYGTGRIPITYRERSSVKITLKQCIAGIFLLIAVVLFVVLLVRG